MEIAKNVFINEQLMEIAVDREYKRGIYTSLCYDIILKKYWFKTFIWIIYSPNFSFCENNYLHNR